MSLSIRKWAKKILRASILSYLSFLCLIMFSPQMAFAAVGTPFGGLEIFELPCTCDAGALNWHLFLPVWILAAGPEVGAFAAPPTPLTFPSFYLKPSSWALGFFEPGAGSACYIGVEPYCIPLLNEGLILPITGTSPTI